MTTKEKIIEGLAELDDAGLAKVHAVVQELSEEAPLEPQLEKPKKTFMQKLREISIYGPPDFAENLDLYMSGAKQIEDVH